MISYEDSIKTINQWIETAIQHGLDKNIVNIIVSKPLRLEIDIWGMRSIVNIVVGESLPVQSTNMY